MADSARDIRFNICRSVFSCQVFLNNTIRMHIEKIGDILRVAASDKNPDMVHRPSIEKQLGNCDGCVGYVQSVKNSRELATQWSSEDDALKYLFPDNI